MILSYLRLAWKALFQKRLYTLVSLFGITITLSILFVGASLYDYMLKPNYPEYKQDRILVFDELMAYGSTKDGSSARNGRLSYSFICKYISNLKMPEKIGISNSLGEREVYRNNHKFNLTIVCTDAHYWEIFDFECIEGKLYGEVEINANARVAVITKSTARKYFGSAESALGKSVEIDAEFYRVMGVVKDVPEIRSISHSDIWLPLVVKEEPVPDLFGSCSAYLLVPENSDLNIIRDELNKHLGNFHFQDYAGIQKYKNFTNIQPFVHTHVEKYFWKIFGMGRSVTSAGYSEAVMLKESTFYQIIVLLIFLLMAFPAINLINIHISRYMERSSEIGIRRSYGAKKRIILGQLLAENLVITALGSLLAIVVSFVILHLVEASDLMPEAHFSFNFRILIWGITFTLLFNLLSGIVPAWKISRLHIIQSLKGGEQ